MSDDALDLFGGGEAIAGSAPEDDADPVVPLRRSVVETDAYDVADWHAMYAGAPALQSIQVKWEKELAKVEGAEEDRAGDLLGDLFHSVHKECPQLAPEDGIDPGAKPARSVIAEIEGAEDFERLRESTVLDVVSAALAVKQLSEPVFKRYVEVLEERQQQDKDQEPGDQPGDQPGGSDPQGGDGPGQAPATSPGIQQAVSQAAKQAGGDGARALSDLASSDGKDPPTGPEVPAPVQGTGSLGQRSSDPGRIELAAEIMADESGTFRKVVAQLGRLVAVAKKAARGTMARPAFEAVDVALGDDLTRLLAVEALRLCDDDPVAEFHAWCDWQDKRLLQHGAPTLRHSGPVVVLLDQSGSMRGAADHQAKALALATVLLARQQRRRVYVVRYEDDAMPALDCSAGTGAGPIADLVGTFMGGGTSYAPAMDVALTTIENGPASLRKADVFNITDGGIDSIDDADRRVVQRWKRVRSRHGLRYVELFVGSGDRGGYAQHLPEMVDAHLSVHTVVAGNPGAEKALAQVWAGITDRSKSQWAVDQDGSAQTGTGAA